MGAVKQCGAWELSSETSWSYQPDQSDAKCDPEGSYPASVPPLVVLWDSAESCSAGCGTRRRDSRRSLWQDSGCP